jgi:glycosyltransferase involved in cell wall biosynthesis
VPVVAVDCPVGPSNVLNGGGAGLLVKPGDRDALIEAMNRILTDPELCSRLRAKGFDRARDFEVSIAAQAFERLFLSLASHGRKNGYHY